MKFYLIILISAISLFSSLNPANAMVKDAPEILQNIEKNLAQIKTMETQLIQTSTGQPKAEGSLFLSRPGKLLLTYKEPITTMVVADGYNVIFYDKLLKQITYLDIDETPAFFILKENFSFEDQNIEVLDVSRKNGLIEVTMTQKKNPLAGKITLFFKEKNLNLISWVIVDARRIKTNVSLKNTKYNVPIDENIFVFKNPNRIKKF